MYIVHCALATGAFKESKLTVISGEQQSHPGKIRNVSVRASYNPICYVHSNATTNARLG